MELSFHGADRDVTGSCHLLTVAGKRILVDCGMFQGSRELHEENAGDFGFEPSEIDVLLLTHAHLDHCGRIPLLVRRGFRGEIIATSATRELARLVLLDAANLQEEAAGHRRRKAREGRPVAPPGDPLYTVVDALDAMGRFGRTARYGAPLEVAPEVTATFHDAGHILGSASILVEVAGEPEPRQVLFSGDLGPYDTPLLRDPAPPAGARWVVMETTYGDRNHRGREESVDELVGVIRSTVDRGGNVIVPTFALERAQEILFHLREASGEGDLPPDLRVFLDSPMAISATEIFRRHREAFRPEVAPLFEDHGDPFALNGLRFTRSVSASRAINGVHSGAVIMAGSGMCTGGRVHFHLERALPRRDCSVALVGYAARGTPARRLVDGAPHLELFGREVPVRAEVHTVNGFSAHAGRDALLRWHADTGSPEVTFLVHGEEETMATFGEALEGTRVEMPRRGERFELE